MLRGSTGIAGVCGLLLLTGCGAGTSTTTPNTTTETFTGTLPQKGSVSNNFTVTVEGIVTITLTSLSPQSTITVGLAVGTPATTGCSLFSTNESAKVGTVISGDLTPGAYCAGLYDLGNLTGPATYTMTVNHP